MLTNSKNGGGKLSRAFTLIEIVSAIVIVGIIVLITVPITIRLINNAKKKSFLITAEGIVKATSLSLADHEEEYESYFINNDYITFKFSKSEGKEGESVDSINGKKIKLAFEGKSPIGGEINLYKNGDVEVINLTDGTFYVNKDVDTELTINQNTSTFTREELQKMVEELRSEVKDLKEKDKVIEEKNAKQDSNIKQNRDGVESNRGKIVEITKTLDNINTSMLTKTYPVGSIYISISSTNPSTIFGGVWESFGTGRTLVGVNTNDINFNIVEKTGGSASSVLTTSNIPSHSHTVTAKGSVASVFTGSSVTTGVAGGHSHTTSQTSLSNGSAATKSLTGTIVMHNASSATNIDRVTGVFSSGRTNNYYTNVTGLNAGGASSVGIINFDVSHSHTVTGTIPAMTTSKIDNHTHTVTAKGSVSSTFTGSSVTTNSIGSGNSFTNLQPYITVYMWKRTA